MKTLYAASKSHTGADEKRDTNFHWPYGAGVLSITTLQVNLNFCRTSTLPNSWEIRFKNKAKKMFYQGYHLRILYSTEGNSYSITFISSLQKRTPPFARGRAQKFISIVSK